ncbi:MAG: hypothetical protein M1814_003049 [Vezdaea aestivalis]|nr:MAG: hypothetical protein M1814_003049 [Vezdaea aestivalis]
MDSSTVDFLHQKLQVIAERQRITPEMEIPPVKEAIKVAQQQLGDIIKISKRQPLTTKEAGNKINKASRHSSRRTRQRGLFLGPRLDAYYSRRTCYYKSLWAAL